MATNPGFTPAAGADTVLYQSAGRGCTSFMVTCTHASVGVLVHVDGLHTAAEYVPVAPGQTMIFRFMDDSITRVIAQGDGGTSSCNAGIVAKTRAS